MKLVYAKVKTQQERDLFQLDLLSADLAEVPGEGGRPPMVTLDLSAQRLPDETLPAASLGVGAILEVRDDAGAVVRRLTVRRVLRVVVEGEAK